MSLPPEPKISCVLVARGGDDGGCPAAIFGGRGGGGAAMVRDREPGRGAPLPRRVGRRRWRLPSSHLRGTRLPSDHLHRSVGHHHLAGLSSSTRCCTSLVSAPLDAPLPARLQALACCLSSSARRPACLRAQLSAILLVSSMSGEDLVCYYLKREEKTDDLTPHTYKKMERQAGFFSSLNGQNLHEVAANKGADSVRITVQGKKERQMSVVLIEHAETMERGKAKPGGLSDPRLGTIDRNIKCDTCMAGMAECPGHFGHLELAEPMFHIGFIKTVLSIMRCVCFNCSKILSDEIGKANNR